MAKGGIFKHLPRREKPASTEEAGSTVREGENSDYIASDPAEETTLRPGEHANGSLSSNTEVPDTDAASSEKPKLDVRRARKQARQAELKAAHARKEAAKRALEVAREQMGRMEGDENETHDLGGGSRVPLVPQAVEAITQLRKVRDEEDNFARFRDMDRPPLPVAELPRVGGSSQTNGVKPSTASLSAKRGLRFLSRQERDELAQQDKDAADSLEDESIRQEDPEWYIARDEKGTYCKKCGLPLLPDPEPCMLEIWLHALRYRTTFDAHS